MGLVGDSLAVGLGAPLREALAARGVALDARGNFVVAWSSVQDGSATGVFAQR